MADATAVGLMTAEELLRLPDDGWQYELIQGRLIRMAPSSSRPAIVATRLSSRVEVFASHNELGVVGGADWGFRLTSDPDTVRAPDVAFVRAERIPADGIPDGFWPGAPDLAIEVISPTNRWVGMLRKVHEYLDAGARMVWVVDSDARRATVFRPDRAPVTIGEDGVLEGEDVLPGFSLPLRDVLV